MNEAIKQYLKANNDLCLASKGKGRLWKPIYNGDGIVITLLGDTQKKKASWALKIDGKLDLAEGFDDLQFRFTDKDGTESVLKPSQNRSTVDYLSVICPATSSEIWTFAKNSPQKGSSRGKGQSCRICDGDRGILDFSVSPFYLELCVLYNELNAGPFPESAIEFLTPLAEKYRMEQEEKEAKRLEKEQAKIMKEKEDKEREEQIKAELERARELKNDQINRIFKKEAERKRLHDKNLREAEKKYNQQIKRITAAEKMILELDTDNIDTCLLLLTNPLVVPQIKELKATCDETGLHSALLSYFLKKRDSADYKTTVNALESLKKLEHGRPFRRNILYPALGLIAIVILAGADSGDGAGPFIGIGVGTALLMWIASGPYTTGKTEKKYMMEFMEYAKKETERGPYSPHVTQEEADKARFMEEYLSKNRQEQENVSRYAPDGYGSGSMAKRRVKVSKHTVKIAIKVVDSQKVSASDIAKQTGMPYSTAKRIVEQLLEMGVISRPAREFQPYNVLIKNLESLDTLIDNLDLEYEVEY